MSKECGQPYVIEVQGVPPSPNDTMHFQKRRRIHREFKDEAQWQVKGFVLTRNHPIRHARVRVTVTCTRGPFKDEDNLRAALKWVMDALTVRSGGGLIEDDRPGYMDVEVHQVRGAKRGVRIEVSDADMETAT